MSFGGRRGGGGFGRGGGGFGRGGGGFRPVSKFPFELYPEIESLGTAKYTTEDIQLIKWSSNLHKYWRSSPYYYEGKAQKQQNLEIERYSDRNLHSTRAKPPLWHFIKLDSEHVPAELALGDKRVAKKIRWNMESDLQKLDEFEKLEKKGLGKEAENEEEDEEIEAEADEGEYSDEGDYEQNEDFDDDDVNDLIPDDAADNDAIF